MSRADLVLTTGGLGPTSDDRTRDDVAELIGSPLHASQRVTDHIRDYFEKRGRQMPDRVNVQAMIPEGLKSLINSFGTAPGLWQVPHRNPFQDSNPSRLDCHVSRATS